MTMTNTNHSSSPNNHNQLPPLPQAGERGPSVCSIIQLYLAILDELSPEQADIVLAHARMCAACTAVHQLMQEATNVLATLPSSTPSHRVDQAIHAAIVAHSNQPIRTSINQRVTSQPRYIVGVPFVGTRGSGRGTPKHARRLWGTLASITLAAALILAFLVTTHFLSGRSSSQVFSLPTNLTWSGYVLYHRETKIDADGSLYRIDSYHDLGNNHIHVETVMPGSLDVIAIGDNSTTLGLDMMHHVAQWGAEAWRVDETLFNLSQLRRDIDAHRATYLDKDIFRGQSVYRIRGANGLVLLLNMHYQPVNILRGAIGPGTGEPIYDILTLMPTSHVSTSMWNMSIPNGFHMGTLPPKP